MSVPASTVGGMTSPSWPDGPVRPDAAMVNEEIRRLMEQPDSEHDQEHGSEEYRRLLAQWADATRPSDLVKAA